MVASLAAAAQVAGKRGRQPTYGDAAFQTCVPLKIRFGIAQRQTTGFDESLLRLTRLTRDMSDFSTLARRQKTLVVNIPHRGSHGPLCLLVDSIRHSRQPRQLAGTQAQTAP